MLDVRGPRCEEDSRESGKRIRKSQSAIKIERNSL